MKIKVKIHGHHYYGECEGEVLAWVQDVQKFEENGQTKYLQVPAVVIKQTDGVNVVSLTEQLRWTEIDIITE
jgi:hypothetical protein